MVESKAARATAVSAIGKSSHRDVAGCPSVALFGERRWFNVRVKALRETSAFSKMGRLQFVKLEVRVNRDCRQGGLGIHEIKSMVPAPSDIDSAASSGPPWLVALHQVTKHYGSKTALTNVSLTIPPGQICGLLGPNGAGKTTLFRLLMGILKATHGTLMVDGLDAFEDRVAVKRLVGFLPDEPVFHSYLSGREVLELSGGLHGIDVREIEERMLPLIARLGMVDAMNLFAEDYSRGMKKKLGIMLALLHQPKLLILDEPTNGLDVESTRLFYELMHEQSARGTTILFSTHLMDHVTKLCTHAAVLRDGGIVAAGRIDELCAGPEGSRSLEEVFVDLTSGADSTHEDRNRVLPTLSNWD
jgi:ABC-2 type transport system ATP-binding protein